MLLNIRPRCWSDFLVGVTGLLMSLFIYFYLIPTTITQSAARIWMSHPLFQRADIVPRLWTSIIFGSAFIILIQSFISPKENQKSREAFYQDLKESYLSMGVLFGIILLFILLLPIIGFILSSMIFLSLAIWWYGYQNIVMVLITSAITSFLLFFFFTRVLNVIFP